MDGEKPGKTKYPILKIKKDAVVEREYHYKREDRLDHISAPPPPREYGGILRLLFGRVRKRRGGFGSIIFVIVVVAAAFFIFRLAGRERSTAEIAGFRTVLSAVRMEDSLSVSVSFDPVGSGAGKTLPAVVRFIMTDTGETLIVSRELPAGGDVFRGRMAFTGREKSVTAEVEVGTAKKNLSAAIPEVKP